MIEALALCSSFAVEVSRTAYLMGIERRSTRRQKPDRSNIL
jgi:hypothetical protein